MLSKPFDIVIEICSNCKQHAWCTRHNESTYASLAQELKKCIQSQEPEANIQIKKAGNSKLGCF